MEWDWNIAYGGSYRLMRSGDWNETDGSSANDGLPTCRDAGGVSVQAMIPVWQ